MIPAGMPRKPGMTRDDLFNSNASIIRDLAKAAAKVAPKARIGIIANPVNSTVPIFAEVFKAAGVYDKTRLFGVTTLDLLRASAFVSKIAGTNPKETLVPVVGGHSGPTIVPLLSQIGAGAPIEKKGGDELAALVKRIQFGGDEVVKAKGIDIGGSATLSMAVAAQEWTDAVLRAMNGESGVSLYTYVESPLFKDQGVEYFSSKVDLSNEGTVAKINDLGNMTESEQKVSNSYGPEPGWGELRGVRVAPARPAPRSEQHLSPGFRSPSKQPNGCLRVQIECLLTLSRFSRFHRCAAPRGVPARPQEEHRRRRQLHPQGLSLPTRSKTWKLARDVGIAQN